MIAFVVRTWIRVVRRGLLYNGWRFYRRHGRDVGYFREQLLSMLVQDVLHITHNSPDDIDSDRAVVNISLYLFVDLFQYQIFFSPYHLISFQNYSE